MKLRHTNAQFYNFIIFFLGKWEWWGKTNKYKNHIASVQFMNGVCGIHSDEYANFVSLSLSLSLSLELFISCNNNYIFIFIVNHYSMQYKKNIYSALIPLLLFLILNSLLACYCVIVFKTFFWSFFENCQISDFSRAFIN